MKPAKKSQSAGKRSANPGQARARKLSPREGPARRTAPPPAEAAPLQQPVPPARLARLVDLRLKQRAAEWSRVKGRFERVAKAFQQLVVSAASKPVKGGPRRFRPATSKAREFQQQMSELGTELRLITARRPELSWLKQMLTGAGPQLSPSLRELIASRGKAPRA